MFGREAKSEFSESLAAEAYEKLVMGHSIRWYSEESETEISFPKPTNLSQFGKAFRSFAYHRGKLSLILYPTDVFIQRI